MGVPDMRIHLAVELVLDPGFWAVTLGSPRVTSNLETMEWQGSPVLGLTAKLSSLDVG